MTMDNASYVGPSPKMTAPHAIQSPGDTICYPIAALRDDSGELESQDLGADSRFI